MTAIPIAITEDAHPNKKGETPSPFLLKPCLYDNRRETSPITWIHVQEHWQEAGISISVMLFCCMAHGPEHRCALAISRVLLSAPCGFVLWYNNCASGMTIAHQVWQWKREQKRKERHYVLPEMDLSSLFPPPYLFCGNWIRVTLQSGSQIYMMRVGTENWRRAS